MTVEAAVRFDLSELERWIYERLRKRIELSSPEWLSVNGAARYLDTTAAAVRQLIRRGHLTPYRPKGGSVRLSRVEIDEWVRGEG